MAIDPYRSRLISAREEEDKRRPDPASFALNIPGMDALRDMVGGRFTLEDIPGVRGIQQTIENAPKENALLSALYGVTRPGAGVMGGIAAALRGEDALQGAQRGFTGEETVIGSDVLAQQGVGELGRLQLGPLDVSGRDVAGFGLDVAADPLTFLTLGSGTAAKQAGRLAAQSALKQAGEEGLETAARRTAAEGARRVAETKVKKSRPFGGTSISVPFTNAEKEILPFDALSATIAAADRVTRIIPGMQAIKDATRETVGEILTQHYKLKHLPADVRKAIRELPEEFQTPELMRAVEEGGAPEFVERLRKVERGAATYTREALKRTDWVAKRLEPLTTREQLDTVFDALDTGFDLAKAADESVVGTGDEAVDTVVRVLRGEFRPVIEAEKDALGLSSWMENYVYHYFPSEQQFVKQASEGLRRQMERRKIKWFERTGAEGYTTDPLEAIAAEMLSLARKKSAKDMTDFVNWTTTTYGTKLKPKQAVPKGMAAYYPSGAIQLYQTETLTATGRRQLEELATRGDVRPEHTPVQAALYATDAPPVAPGTNLTRAFSVAEPGKQYEFAVEAVPIDQLVPSQLDSLAPNPAFPEGLQPRDRTRAVSEDQINRIVSKPNPDELLVDSHRLDTGPVITRDDMAVVSGNARVLALRRLRREKPEDWAAYQQRMRDMAVAYGLDPATIPPDAVLVRHTMSTIEDWASFADEANTPPIATMSPYEVARRDARRMPAELPSWLVVGENQSLMQSLGSAANREMVQAFTRSLPANELGGISTAEGTLNALGMQRLQDALLARTFSGDAGRRLSETFVESLDPGVKSVENAIYGALGELAKTENLIATGKRDTSLSIAEDLARATQVLARLRQEGESVSTYLAQGSLFDRELTPLQEQFLAFLAGASRTPSKIRELLQDYARGVQNAADPNQMGMFGDASFVTKDELLSNLIDKYAKEVPSPSVADDAAEAAANINRPALERELLELRQRMRGATDAPLPAEESAAITARIAEIEQSLAATPKKTKRKPKKGTSVVGEAPSAPAKPSATVQAGARGAAATSPAPTLDDYIRTTLGARLGERWALPAPMARTLGQLIEPRETIKLMKQIDTVQAIWKASVYSLWPASHVKNALGDTILNEQAGVHVGPVYVDAFRVMNAVDEFAPTQPVTLPTRPSTGMRAAPQTADMAQLGETGADALRGTPEGAVADVAATPSVPGLAEPGTGSKVAISMDGQVVPVGTDGAMPAADFMQDLEMSGVVRGGFWGAEVPTQMGTGDVGGKLGKVREAFKKLNLFTEMQKAAAAREDGWRVAHVLGRMRRGDTLEMAKESAIEHLFDYSALSPAMKNIRRAAPFITWQRFNVPLQVKKLAREPRQAAAISRVAESIGGDESLTDEEKSLMPNYWTERLAIVIGRNEEGKPQILSGLGIPVEDLSMLFAETPRRTVDRWIGMASPLFKWPYETMADMSTFTGRHITDESYQNLYREAAPFISKVPGLRDWLEMTESKGVRRDGKEVSYYNVNPMKMYTLTSVLGRLYYVTAKVTDPDRALASRVLATISPGNVSTFDPERTAVAATRPDWTRKTQRVVDERNAVLEQYAQAIKGAKGPEQAKLLRSDYRKARGDAFQEASAIITELQAEETARLAEMDPRKVAAIEKYMPEVDRALSAYYAIDADDPRFADESGLPDMEQFFDARDAFMDSLPDQLRQQVRTRQLAYIDKLAPAAREAERSYQKALDSYRQYVELPPYAAPVSASDLKRMRELNREYMAAGDTQTRAQWRIKQRPEDNMLLGRYFAIRQYRSPQRRNFEKAHPELAEWGLVR